MNTPQKKIAVGIKEICECYGVLRLEISLAPLPLLNGFTANVSAKSGCHSSGKLCLCKAFLGAELLDAITNVPSDFVPISHIKPTF